MNKFQKLAELNKDIELLEAYGKLKSASILHDKFIRVAQESDQVMDEDFLQKEIKRLADEFEDYIQNAILGRNVNNSLDTAKHNIDQVEKYVGPKYSQNIKDYANAQLDIMRKRFADMYQKYHVNDNADQSSKPSSFGKLSGAEEVSVYVRIIKQIKALLKRKNIPAAMKLSSDYRNWFSDQDLNKTFQANVDNLLRTIVDNKKTDLPAASMSSVNESVNSQNPTIAPLSKMQGGKVEPISSYPSLPPSANMSSVDESVNSQNPTIAPLSRIQDSKVEPIPSSPTSPQSNKTDDYFTMANIEKILKSDSKNKFREASTIFETLYREIPKPSTPKYMGEEENPEYQEALKKWEKATDALAGQYQSLIKKYRKNLRLVDKKDDVYAKSTPEQAKISALWQAKYNKIYNSKLPRMKKYQELKKIHEIVQRLWQNGKISKAALETFNDMKLKTNNLNSSYPLPGDPGFVPEII
jgi:hypothetical protein